MPTLVNRWAANYSKDMQDAVAASPRSAVEILAKAIPEPADSCDAIVCPASQPNAACRDRGSDFFFPANCVQLEAARRFCAGCPVSEECLTTALADPSLLGVWAGTSARERRYLLSQEGLGWG